MPPPTQFSGQFFGDYTGLDAFDDAHPDLGRHARSRPVPLPRHRNAGEPADVCLGIESAGPQAGLTANDEDIFTAGVVIPNG